jgi:hypothetical protein
MKRPLGQFPPWGGTRVQPTGQGFTPWNGSSSQGAEKFNWQIDNARGWLYQDAIELKNFKLGGTSGIHGHQRDAFCWDPLRKARFFGGQVGSSTSGWLLRSLDGLRWTRVGTSTLPVQSTGSDTLSFYNQASSDDGRYFTWRSDTHSTLLATQKAYLNPTGGINSWAASANQPTTLISHAYWAQADNRFVVCGINTSTLLSSVWQVDVDTDTWFNLPIAGATVEACPFGAAGGTSRVIATGTKLWQTPSVANPFSPIPVPWQSLIGFAWLPGAFVFVAVSEDAIYSSPNGVVWSKIVTGFEGSVVFTGAVGGLGDACLVSCILTTADGEVEALLLGINSLRSWSAIPPPLVNIEAIIPIGDRLQLYTNDTNPVFLESLGV